MPSLPLLSSCSGPKRFRAGGSGGMLSGGHAACTGCAESSRQSRRQCECQLAAWRRAHQGSCPGMGLSSSLLPEMFHSWCPFPLGLTAVMGYGALSSPSQLPEPYLHVLWTLGHFPGPQFLSHCPAVASSVLSPALRQDPSRPCSLWEEGGLQHQPPRGMAQKLTWPH